MSKPVFDMTRENAVLSSVVKRVTVLCEESGRDWRPIVKDLISKDYEHMVEVVDKHFGHQFAILSETRL